jgi:hypothetical protein
LINNLKQDLYIICRLYQAQNFQAVLIIPSVIPHQFHRNYQAHDLAQLIHIFILKKEVTILMILLLNKGFPFFKFELI